MNEIIIDGSYGEGGGQILRTSLALSMVTGRPVRIKNIRAKRPKPGIMRQHLCSVEAATAISKAKVEGAQIGSQELLFHPQSIESGQYRFSIGSAGSTALVFQTIFPALIQCDKKTELVIEGGTHNPFAPCFDFLNETFIPVLHRIGFNVDLHLERYGFYPAGGGRLRAIIQPSQSLKAISMEERRADVSISGTALVANLSTTIASRELKVLKNNLNLQDDELKLLDIKESSGPGNAVFVKLRSDEHCEVIIEYGRIGTSAEKVSYRLINEVKSYLKSTCSVGKYLADQLLIPMVMSRGGSFLMPEPTEHFKTNVFIIEQFFGKCISYSQLSKGHWKVEVRQSVGGKELT